MVSPPNKFDDADNEADNHAADEQRTQTGRQEREQREHLRRQPDDPAENCTEQLEDELQNGADRAEQTVYDSAAEFVQQLLPPRRAGVAGT